MKITKKWCEDHKCPLAHRLSAIFITLFVVGFMALSFMAYKVTERTLFNSEKAKVDHTVRHIVDRLSTGTSPYTLGSLAEVIYLNAATDSILEKKGQYYFSRTERDVTNMLYSNQEIYVYGKDDILLFTTDNSKELLDLQETKGVASYQKDKERGLLMSKVIYSDRTGEAIGAVQVYHDLNYYYDIRRQLFKLVFVLLVIGFILGFVLLNYVTKRFLEPVRNLHGIMRSISEHPDNLSMRSEVKSGDEFEELSKIFDGMLDRLEEHGKLQAQFISDVSHELRTPVAVIQGHLGLLMRWGKDDPEILNESLSASYDETNRMSLMIKEMLDMVRVQGSFEQHKNDTANVNDAIRTVITNFKVLRPDFIFEEYCDSEDLTARIYSNHLEQALTIILDNAVKYSLDDKEITFNLCRDEKEIILAVRDRGEGIAKEDLQHIFERFYRTDKSRNRVSTRSGLGIGLSILKQIVNAYDCRIAIDSEPGKGTTVTLYLPLAEG